MKNELIDAAFPPLSYKVEGAKQYARILLKSSLRSIDEYQWRVFRVSNISIELDGDIENFQRISPFHDSRQQKLREITRPARNFIYCNGPPLKFNGTYMHSSTTPGQIPHTVTSVAYPYRLQA